ncbi:Gag-pol polyprotein [Frankliniella fusca]|uniref:RNA-directed DNA polymerase n=1 Tax=Frankliniella fusca TaxID=407009 RepID=A0AAE1LJB3_9NEOP|nr:Gag-pol polyprotein [Frankliniella fusca]
MNDGLLYRRFVDVRRPPVMQLLVPQTFVKDTCQQFHDAPGSGGHLSANKMLEKIGRHYYWPGMCSEVKLWCMCCSVCRRKFGGGQRVRAPLTLHNVGAPWERVGVDIAGPFPTTERGNRYLLIAVDYFSRWPEALPIPSVHSHVVARALVDHIFCRFGVPQELHSDRGSSFESEVFKSVMELLGVRKTRSTPQRPQSNGAAERLIRMVTVHLALIVQTAQRTWDLQVPLVMMSLRVAPHATTGVSPAMLLFGRQLGLPPGLARGYPPGTAALPSRLEYPSWLQSELYRLHHETRDYAAAVALRQKERYDVRAKRHPYKVADRVWLFEPRRRVGRAPKLESWWTGPWEILDIINDVTARIRLADKPPSRPRTFHVDRLAPYRC